MLQREKGRTRETPDPPIHGRGIVREPAVNWLPRGRKSLRVHLNSVSLADASAIEFSRYP